MAKTINIISKVVMFTVCIIESLLELAKGGLLIDCDELAVDNEKVYINIYSIGKYTDMDKILNETKRLKKEATCKKRLTYRQNKWEFTQ